MVLVDTVRSAVQAAANTASDLPLLAGGKSLGGRMTSLAVSKKPLAGVHGLVFLGFPLHPARQPGIERAAHLPGVALPMLFLQGTRDALADLDRMRSVCDGLGDQATLHVVDGGDHSFNVLKRSGRTEEQVMAELAQSVSDWVQAIG